MCLTTNTEAKVLIVMTRMLSAVVLAQASITLLSPGLAVANDSCSDSYVSAQAIRTREDIRTYVLCAAEYVTEHGTEEARRAFHGDERWRHGPYYIFVDLLADPREAPLAHIAVFPPDPSREGPSGPLVDDFGTDYFHELHRTLSIVDCGWIYYAFTNFVSGVYEPKSTYVKVIDWDGHRAAIGAGIYLRDLPGTCNSAEVNAAALDAGPSDEQLQVFVRCAASMVESMGYFAGPVLSSDSRWRSGSIYVFGVNTLTGEIEFSGGGASSFAASGRIPELLFGGRDLVAVGADFGESFSYYRLPDPATGEVARKVAFVKRVVVQGVALLVGSGYLLSAVAGSN